MSPLSGGVGCTLAQYEQIQSTALFAAQGLTIPTKSEPSPTQNYLNIDLIKNII
ncbi:hypothetical protein [Acinetobacter sp.]|uniref:hypothetical protein n=1 Tax=Acinetobacter sp. TaxID=472 RepID=UPI003B00121B